MLNSCPSRVNRRLAAVFLSLQLPPPPPPEVDGWGDCLSANSLSPSRPLRPKAAADPPPPAVAPVADPLGDAWLAFKAMYLGSPEEWRRR